MRRAFRRRREGVTDYLKREKLLRSGAPRVVFRKTNKYIIAQYVTSKESKDKTEISVNSKELLKHGWPKEMESGLKSLAAAYLTGFMIGKKISKGKKETPILDFGMIASVHKTKPFAFLKGLIDSGIEMRHKKEDMFPEEDRIMGKHMNHDFSPTFEKIKSNIEKI